MTRRRSIASLAAMLIQTLPHGLLAQSLPDGFTSQDIVLEPFAANPVGFALLPDGRALIIEKDSGNVRLAAAGSQTSVVVHTFSGVSTSLEEGLVGIAVDPQWPVRPYVYFHMTQPGSVLHIVMVRASGDLSNPSSTNLQLDSPYLLLNDIPNLQGYHQGGTLRFDADHFLYVSLGDDGTPCSAQDRTTYGGKILRLDVSQMPGAGSGPPPKSALTPADNPYAASSNAIERLVYSYGLRNPFRFNLDSLTRDLFIGDVGENTWEEVDHHAAAPRQGINFGWPEFEAWLQDPRPDSDSCSVAPFANPAYAYTHGFGVSVVMGPLYRLGPFAPHNFPQQYDGSLFVADFYGKWIRRLIPAGNGWSIATPVPGQPNPTDWARDMGNIADIQQSLNGDIYFLTLLGTPSVARGLHRISAFPASDRPLEPGERARVRFAPNPARAGTMPSLRLASRAGVLVHIYDPAGRLVRTLHPAAAEPLRADWDGRTEGGARVAPGTYVFRLVEGGAESARGKITILR